MMAAGDGGGGVAPAGGDGGGVTAPRTYMNKLQNCVTVEINQKLSPTLSFIKCRLFPFTAESEEKFPPTAEL